jgi:hypothetical protein
LNLAYLILSPSLRNDSYKSGFSKPGLPGLSDIISTIRLIRLRDKDDFLQDRLCAGHRYYRGPGPRLDYRISPQSVMALSLVTVANDQTITVLSVNSAVNFKQSTSDLAHVNPSLEDSTPSGLLVISTVVLGSTRLMDAPTRITGLEDRSPSMVVSQEHAIPCHVANSDMFHRQMCHFPRAPLRIPVVLDQSCE